MISRKYKSSNNRKLHLARFSDDNSFERNMRFVATDNESNILCSIIFQMNLITHSQLQGIFPKVYIDGVLLELGFKMIKQKIESNDSEETIVSKDRLEEMIRNNQTVESEEEIFVSSVRIQQDILACLYEKTNGIATLRELSEYVWCEDILLYKELAYLNEEGLVACTPVKELIAKWQSEIKMSSKGRTKYIDDMKGNILKNKGLHELFVSKRGAEAQIKERIALGQVLEGRKVVTQSDDLPLLVVPSVV